MTDEQAAREYAGLFKLPHCLTEAIFLAGAQHGRKAALADLTEKEAYEMACRFLHNITQEPSMEEAMEAARLAFSTLQRLRGG